MGIRIRVTAVEGRNLPDCDLKKPDSKVTMSIFMQPSTVCTNNKTSSSGVATDSPPATVTSHYEKDTYEPFWDFSGEFVVEDEGEAILVELGMRPPQASVIEALRAKGILPKIENGKAVLALQREADKRQKLNAKTLKEAAAAQKKKEASSAAKRGTRLTSPPPPGATSTAKTDGPETQVRIVVDADRSGHAAREEDGNYHASVMVGVANPNDKEINSDPHMTSSHKKKVTILDTAHDGTEQMGSPSGSSAAALQQHHLTRPLLEGAARSDSHLSAPFPRTSTSALSQRSSSSTAWAAAKGGRHSFNKNKHHNADAMRSGGDDDENDEEGWDSIVKCPDYVLGRTIVPVGCALRRQNWLQQQQQQHQQQQNNPVDGVDGVYEIARTAEPSAFIVYDNWHRLADCRKGGPELRIRVEVIETVAETKVKVGDGAEAERARPEGAEQQQVALQNGPTAPPNNSNIPNDVVANASPTVSGEATTPPSQCALPPGWYFIKNCHNTYMCLAPHGVLQTVTMGEWCRVFIDVVDMPSTTGHRAQSTIKTSASTASVVDQQFGRQEKAAERVSEEGGTPMLREEVSFPAACGAVPGAPQATLAARFSPLTTPTTRGADQAATAEADSQGVRKLMYTMRSSANVGMLDAYHQKTKGKAKKGLSLLHSKLFHGSGGGADKGPSPPSSNANFRNANKKESSRDDAAGSVVKDETATIGDFVSHNFAALRRSHYTSNASPDHHQWHMVLADTEDPAGDPHALFEIVPHPRHAGKWLIHSPAANVNVVAKPGGWGAGYTSISGKASDWATFDLIRAPPISLRDHDALPEGTYLIQTCLKTYLCGMKKRITHRKGNDDSVKVRIRREIPEGAKSVDDPAFPTPVYSMQTAFGNTICYENGRCEPRSAVGAWEKFEILAHPTLPNRHTIYSPSFKTFLSIKGFDELSKVKNSDVITEREAFGFIRVDGPLD